MIGWYNEANYIEYIVVTCGERDEKRVLSVDIIAHVEGGMDV
jgi:hypothetical protein